MACRRSRLIVFLVISFVAVLPQTAMAHTESGVVGGFLTGLDHMVAMVAVGLWGAFLGMPALWILPVVFPLVMAFGGALGVLGVPLPAVELGIAFSGVMLGLVVALAAKPPLWGAALMVAFFGLLHGHAHGTELPQAAHPASYAMGFVIATGLLHLGGIGFGFLTRWPQGKIAVRAAGAAIGVVGGLFLFGII
jgi:urease accessory protein